MQSMSGARRLLRFAGEVAQVHCKKKASLNVLEATTRLRFSGIYVIF